ncbi:uncharacterized protein LOC121756394 [Salvia splendens]|uniref:uncharacterized protein LOC121756394 n=1 Tax=Salvia splendens TaxID=180675 RepID=UPI001C27336E|nr:uncharacterized protein LOC121756394 [Salvia splendens]
MPSEETGDQGTPQVNPGEWLNLSLGGEPPRASRESENAHKRERGAVRHYQSHKMMAMMALPVPIRTSMFRSLGVQAHSLVHKPGRDGNKTVARFSEADTRFGIARQHGTVEGAADSMWPGSFRPEPQQPEQKSSNSTTMLDLNLKL